MQGLYYEELEIGTTVETAGRTITESDIVTFAGLSGDYNPLHTDAVYAAQTPFGARVAHGMLGLSVATGLSYRLGFLEGTVEAFIGVEWKFRAPIFIGDTIHARITVKEKREMPGYAGGLVTLDVVLLNQEGKRVQKGRWTLLVRARPSAEEET